MIGPTRVPHRLWLAPMVFAGVLGLTNAIGAVILLINNRWIEAVLGVVTVVTAYWFAIGSWRRTPWGLATPENAPPMSEPLPDRGARVYLTVALACVALSLVAFGLQALVLADR